MFVMRIIKNYVLNLLKIKNKSLWIAFILGIALQLFVVETPGIQSIFSTNDLTAAMWGITLILSLLPLIVHEFIVIIQKFKHK